MKKTNLSNDDVYSNPELHQKAEDAEFRIKIISSIIVMLAIVIIVIAGKFVVKQVSEQFNEKSAPIEQPVPEIKMDFDADSIITEDELNELNESLDDILEDFTESDNQSTS